MSLSNNLTKEMTYLATGALCHLYVSLGDEATSHVHPTTGKTCTIMSKEKAHSCSQITYKKIAKT